MKLNNRGSVLIVALVTIILIVVGGLIVGTGLSRKVDQKTVYTYRTGGKARLLSEIKNIPRFYDDFLASNRNSGISSALVNRCIPPQSDTVAQNFSGCTSSQTMSTVAELNTAYGKAKEGKLPTISSGSFIMNLPLVSFSELRLSGTNASPALFDVSGAPCASNCTFSVASYMIKQSNPGNPGDVILAFKVSEIQTSAMAVHSKDDWIFVPLVKEVWNAMPADGTGVPICPTGSYAVKIKTDRTVICRDMETECADGQMLVGLNDNGDAVCSPAPMWPPVANYDQQDCNSWDYKNASCPWANTDPNTTIVSMSVAYKRSKSGCSFGSSFGFTNGSPKTLWVRSGCRALFNVDAKCNGGYSLNTSTQLCTAVGIGQYSPNLDDAAYNCTNKPANSHYTGSGGATNSCPWACDINYQLVSGSCVFVPPPTPTPAPPTPTPAPTATPTATPDPSATVTPTPTATP